MYNTVKCLVLSLFFTIIVIDLLTSYVMSCVTPGTFDFYDVSVESPSLLFGRPQSTYKVACSSPLSLNPSLRFSAWETLKSTIKITFKNK